MSALFARFGRDDCGNFGIMSALLAVPLILAVGVSIDFARAYNRKVDAQSAADSAILAGSTSYTGSSSLSTVASQIDTYLAANAGSDLKRIAGPTVNSDATEICITVQETVATTLMQIVAVNSVPVSVQSCSAIGQTSVEVSLVLDVSSSMREDGRFTPMQKAVQTFLGNFSNNAAAINNSRIAIVPFSSRVNFGMTKTGWLRAYNGSAAVPTRWTTMSSYYGSSSYTLATWVDSTTQYAYTSKPNYYWAGCVEPRADVEVYENGSFSSTATGDAPPSTQGFVAMDTNPGAAGQFSYCPPPIIGLTNDFATLRSAVTKMTSEGSTRLDAGIVAGWYTLSPRWRSAWGGSVPQDYSSKVRKVLIFMTDGEMNVKYGVNSNGASETDKLDWLCSNNKTDSCNTTATKAFLATCEAIKKAGIEIYTVSYGSDADTANLKTCSSGTDYALNASTSNIQTVYDAIAKNLTSGMARLTR